MSEFRGKHASRLREIANTGEYKTAEREILLKVAREFADMVPIFGTVEQAAGIIADGQICVRTLLAEIDRLRGAIETHRRNIWVEGPVEHDEDIQLYAALRRGGSDG